MKVFKNIRKLINAFDHSQSFLKGNNLSKVSEIENAYLIEDKGLILDFGEMSNLKLDTQNQQTIDCTGKFIIPSFIDSHTHLVFPRTREKEFVDRIKGRSYEEIASNGGGILNSAKKTQDISEEDLFESAKRRLDEIINMGTAAVEIKSGYGLSLESELKLLRAANRIKEISPITVKTTFLGAHAVPQGISKEDYVDSVINEMIPEVAKQKLADYCDVFCDRGFFSFEDTNRILEAAEKYGMKSKIHANELDFSGGIQAGVKNHSISVDHLECTGDEEIAALLSSDTIPTLLPSTAFFLGIEYPPARKMIDSGLGVSLASDYNPGSSPSGNMSFVLSLACLKLKMLPEEALNAATINAAHAMELGDSHGGIYKNGIANFLVTEEMESLSFLAYNFGRPSIDQVILNGDILN
jgi:imidazolonepropionase